MDHVSVRIASTLQWNAFAPWYAVILHDGRRPRLAGRTLPPLQLIVSHMHQAAPHVPHYSLPFMIFCAALERGKARLHVCKECFHMPLQPYRKGGAVHVVSLDQNALVCSKYHTSEWWICPRRHVAGRWKRSRRPMLKLRWLP
jgi:hypothetical protein